MANPLELHDHVGVIRALMCGTCTNVYPLDYKIMAEECCNPELRRRNEEHRMEEAQANARAAEQERVLKAKVYSAADYKGPVMVPCLNERGGLFFSSIDELRSTWPADQPEPDVIWTCYERVFELRPADELIQQEIGDSEHYDGIADLLPDTKDIDAAIVLFNVAAKEHATWYPDYRARVAL